jgi:hypothetical protein
MNLTSKRAFIALLVVFLLILSLPTAQPSVSAQEATEEPTPVVTDESISSTEPPISEQATEVIPPPEVVTEVPTEVLEPTLEPEITVEATESVEVTATAETTETVEVTATAEVTEPSEVVTVTPETTTAAPTVTSFTDDFETFSGSGWLITDWQPVADSDNTYLGSVLPLASATIDGFNETHFELNATLRVALDNTASIAFRSGSESYFAVFNSVGSSRLYRGNELLDFYTMPETVESEPTWFNVQIIVANDTISISVNGIAGIVYTDAAPLEAGLVSFRTGETNTGEVAVDNVVLNVVDPATIVFPTEALPLPTPEAEVTPEVTAEVTAEVTPEVTPELDPITLALAKMDANLRGVLESSSDNNELLLNLYRNLFEFDGNNLVLLEIAFSAELPDAEVNALLTAYTLTSYGIAGENMVAGVPVERIMDVALDERVLAIRRPDLAVSTSSNESGSEEPAGTIASSAYDILGVQDWHNSGITGAGVKIGVIDNGFATNIAAIGDEHTCYEGLGTGLGIGTGNHGLRVVEVLCDMVPDAEVYGLSVVTYPGLSDAIATAMSMNLDILVITLDLSASASPGDGAGSSDEIDDPYKQLEAARNAGIIILAAAGNSGINDPGDYTLTSPRTSLYTAFTFSSMTEGATETVTFEISAADAVRISWSDWNGYGANNLPNGPFGQFGEIEDFNFELRKGGILIPDNDGISLASRTRRGDEPSALLLMGVGEDDACPTDTCPIELVITRVSGDAAVDFQVQLVPKTAFETNPLPDEPNRLVYIKSVSAPTFASGTLARPADSPAVIAVGAVCANESSNFALLPDSSVGPRFGINGSAPVMPSANSAPSIPFERNEILPHISSFAHVNLSLDPLASATACDGTIAGSFAAAGFDGTSAAAAHTGGMVALLLSKDRARFDTNSPAGVAAMLDYLQTHSAEPPGTSADSFDKEFGAGIALLGSPEYNLNHTQNIPLVPEALPATCSGNNIYVGQAQVDGVQNGSPTAPYTSLAFAIQQASANDCIIVMPGEYVTPIVIPSSKSNIGIYSYNSVTGVTYPDSVIRIAGQYLNGTYQTFDNNAGVYLDGATNITLQGLHFVPSATYLTTSSLHQGLVAYDSDGLVLRNNRFGADAADVYDGWTDGDTTPVLLFSSDNVLLEGNTFRGNTAGFTLMDMAFPAIAIIDSGAGSNKTRLIDNSFQNNTATSLGTIDDLWSSVVYVNNSAVDMVANDFNGNTASTIITAQTATAASTEPPLRIVSNVFINNTSDAGGETAGPLIHAYYVPNLYVINNTFAQNNLTASDNPSGSHSSIVGRGNRLNDGNGSLGADVSLDFFNNLVYDNNNTMTQGVISDPSTSLACANNNVAGNGNATVSNWWYSSDNLPLPVGCDLSGNGNDTTNSPATEFIGVFANLTLNTSMVNYWGLRQTNINPDTYSRGIDFSSVETSSDGSINLAVAPFNRDINNRGRVTNVADWESGAIAPDTELIKVDVGAFEFNKLSIIDTGQPDPKNYLHVGNEDNGFNNVANTSPIIIDLNEAVKGGFGQIIFTVTDYPDFFGTQCPSYPNTVNGTTLGTGINNGKLFYCPPQHFYTDPTPEAGTELDPIDEWLEAINFAYTVYDESTASDSGTVELRIQPGVDTPLNEAPVTLGDKNPEDDIFRVTGNVGTTVNVVLRPFVSFNNNNFLMSEINNIEFHNPAASVFRMDYPFTFDNFQVTPPVGGIIENPATDIVPTATGLSIKLSDNSTGLATIEYTITDANGSGSTMQAILEVRSVSRIPVDVGVYDDSSFVFDYRDALDNDANGVTEGSWTALYNATSINNTLHRTNLLNDNVTFGFKNNSGFVLYMQGQGAVGGVFDMSIEIDDGAVYSSLNGDGTAWQLAPGSVAGVSAVYEVNVGPFKCSTTGVLNTPTGRRLSSAVAGFYTINCNNDLHNPNIPTTYIVKVTNLTAGRFIAVDAMAIIDDTDTDNAILNVGYHDVDSTQVRGIFGPFPSTQWTEVRGAAYSNSVAMRAAIGVATPDDLSFYVTGGPGFAIETALQPSTAPMTYTVCVRDATAGSPNENQRTCQDFNNRPDAVTAARYRVFRPFYGLDPNRTYEVTIENITIAPNGLFIIDSIVVFDPTTTPETVVEGVVEADELEYFVYGGGIEESWRLNLRDTTATNQSSITLAPGIAGAGPYIAFETHLDVTSIYYSYSEALVSQQTMICVDRGAGAGTEVGNDDYGNCLLVNLLTGTYQRITAGGELDPNPASTTDILKVGTGTIRISEDQFSRLWEGSDTGGDSAPDVHIIEIFSVHDKRLSLDRIVALGDNIPLSAGRYEEYTDNINYYTPDVGNTTPDPDDMLLLNRAVPADIGVNATTNILLYSGQFTQVTGAGALYDSARSIMYTKKVGNVITFEVNGTGFAPMIRYARDGGAINICWQAYTAPAIPAPEVILTDGTCQIYDTESARVGRNVPLPVMGLPVLADGDFYAVAMEFIGDDFNTPNSMPTSVLWFDGLTVYDDNLYSRLTALEPNVTYEGNFNTRFTANRFAYFGDTWRYLASPTFATYSNRDYDTITAGGATIAFRTTGANSVIVDRPLRTGYAPLLICAQPELTDAENVRHCGIIDMTGAGNRNEFTFELTDSLTPSDYIVTITDLDGGAYIFDAVRTVATPAMLTAGLYDDDHPAFVFDRYATNLVRNGNMERLDAPLDSFSPDYWVDNAPTVSDRFTTLRYRNLFSRRVTTNGGGSMESLPFTLTAGQSYNFVAYVYIPSTTGGTVEVTVETSDGVTTVVPAISVTEFNKWIPVHYNFVQAGNLSDVVVSFTGTAALYYVDDVEINEGSNWQAVGGAIYYGGFATFNKSRGAEFAFNFEGTGFALGVPTNPTTGGEMRVCWLYNEDSNPAISNADVINGGNCITYQQQTPTINNNNIRVVTGLPFAELPSGSYRVVVSDIEDGRMNSVNPALVGTARNALYGVGTITLDWVEIFNQTAPVTTTGVYSESATTLAGERHLLLQPASRWNIFSAPTLTTFSDLSYVGAVNTLKALDGLASGPAATVTTTIEPGQSATIIFDVAAALPTASNQLLACVGAPDGELVVNNLTATTRAYELVDTDGTKECVILPILRTSRYITLNSDSSLLPLLFNETASPVNRTVTITTLTNGLFRIDDFQVISSSTLPPGYYEETIGTSLIAPSDAAVWTRPNLAAYSGGSALETTSTDVQTLTFEFEGTGVSVVTAFLTNGGVIDLQVMDHPDVTDGADVIDPITETLDTRKLAARYGTSLNIAGLPNGTYRATLTINNGAGEKTVVDAIEVYGELPELGSLYDDADVDATGTPLITYGPNNRSWVELSGTLAVGALNRTLHSGNMRGAIAAFEIGAVKPASGIVVFYADTTTAPTVEVCFREIGGNATDECTTVTVNDDQDKKTVSAPAAGISGNYYVTIENISDAGNFVFDAVQVVENAFSEGIYDAAYIASRPIASVFPAQTSNLMGTNIELAGNEIINLNVDADMTGFAFVLQHAAGTSTNYEVRVFDTADIDGCTINDCLGYESWPIAGSTVPATGASALTYVGLHDLPVTNPPNTYTVQLKNNGPGTLRFSHFHVMDADDTLLIADKERYENDDAQVRYLPFGSWIEEINRLGDASEQSQHLSQMQGAIAYFEFDDAADENIGFEFARQVALTGYANVQVCYGRIGLDTLFDARNGVDHDNNVGTPDIECTVVLNNTTTGFRATQNIATPAANYCGVDGCWASVRTLGTVRNTFDFIRLYDAANPLLQAGYYENTADGLDYIILNTKDDTPVPFGTWAENVTLAAASGGSVARASVPVATTDVVRAANDIALRDGSGPAVSFLMEGTGFSAYFTANNLADEVKICILPYTVTPPTVAQTLEIGVCQLYDNQTVTPVYRVARRVLGLPDGQYRVVIQMLADNGNPALHAPTLANLTMELDAVEIHDTNWLLTNDLAGGRYETHYRNQAVDNNFTYLGATWATSEAPSLTPYSGRNYDLARQYGASIVFRTTADAITLYTNGHVSYAPFRMCVTPTTSVLATRCQDYRHLSTAVGIQKPLTFQFAAFGSQPAVENIVTISALTNQLAYFDAIEAHEVYDDGNAPLPLAAGTYDSTHAHVFFDNNYQQFVINGNMERYLLWTHQLNPTQVLNTINARYQGTYGYYVDAGTGTGKGIASHGFELTEGGRYTLVARVRVRAGSVRVRLVEGDGSTSSIPEFTSATVNVSPLGLVWQTVRVDFTLRADSYTGYDAISNDGLRVQIVSAATGTKFDVDDVSLNYGGLWAGEYAAAYTNLNLSASKSHGSSFTFAFDGTGFELGTVANVMAGEMEVCYITAGDYSTNITNGDGFQSAECFTYQQESALATANARRSVTGLTANTYYVRVRDVEDGDSNIVANRTATQRNPLYSVAKIAIDYIRIYNDPFVAESIDEAVFDGQDPQAYYTVPAGFYDEDARHPITGEQFLRLSPPENWKLIEGAPAVAYSGQSYYAAVDALGRADAMSAGQTAVLYVDVPANGAAVILNTAIAAAANSNQLMICAGDAAANDGYGGETVWSGTVYSIASSTECILRDIRLNSVAVVTGSDLAALNGSNAGVKRIMFTTLGRGLFYIDSYQVIHGSTLPAGIYDSALPDSLLNFNINGTGTVNTTIAACTLVQLDTNWCVRKSTTTYGRSAVVTQALDATLNFNIHGTGFSVLTSVNTLGADFTICYGKTLASGSAPSFPSRNSIVDGSRNLIWSNNTQNLDQGGIYCDVLTSNSTRWAARFPDRYLPLGTQYGFSYYGLPEGNYSVQVRMIDNTLTALSTQVLEIDGIVVFSEYTGQEIRMTAGFYDSATAPISYEGAPFWQTLAYPYAYPLGAYGRSEQVTKYAGAIAQMEIEGNAITLYQTINTNRSRDVRICLLISLATIHCTQNSDTTTLGIAEPPELPDTPAPYALAVDMANFSQNGALSYFTPIMFYGLGEGDHQLIFENRDHNRFMGIDAVLVHD